MRLTLAPPHLALILTLTPALSLALSLDPRTPSTCPIPSSQTCSQSLPSNFCCPPSKRCIPLAGATTALCCPIDSQCILISTISCDVSSLSVQLFPDTELMTTALGERLPVCENGRCCPFGFGCGLCREPGGEIVHCCRMMDDQSLVPGDGGGDDGEGGDGESGESEGDEGEEDGGGDEDDEDDEDDRGSKDEMSEDQDAVLSTQETSTAVLESTANPALAEPTNSPITPSQTPDATEIPTLKPQDTSPTEPPLSTSSSSPDSSNQSPPAGLIAGSIIGSAAGLVLLVFLFLFCTRYRRLRHSNPEKYSASVAFQRSREYLAEKSPRVKHRSSFLPFRRKRQSLFCRGEGERLGYGEGDQEFLVPVAAYSPAPVSGAPPVRPERPWKEDVLPPRSGSVGSLGARSGRGGARVAFAAEQGGGRPGNGMEGRGTEASIIPRPRPSVGSARPRPSPGAGYRYGPHAGHPQPRPHPGLRSRPAEGGMRLQEQGDYRGRSLGRSRPAPGVDSLRTGPDGVGMAVEMPEPLRTRGQAKGVRFNGDLDARGFI